MKCNWRRNTTSQENVNNGNGYEGFLYPSNSVQLSHVEIVVLIRFKSFVLPKNKRSKCVSTEHVRSMINDLTKIYISDENDLPKAWFQAAEFSIFNDYFIVSCSLLLQHIIPKTFGVQLETPVFHRLKQYSWLDYIMVK